MTDEGTFGHCNVVAPLPDSAGLSADAFSQLYRELHDPVRRALACLGVPMAQLDDALQEVFVVAYRRLGDPQLYTSVKSWVYGVARRVAWRHHRTERRSQGRLALLDEPVVAEVSADQALQRREALEFMGDFLNGLDAPQREVFVLAEIEQLSAPEIAAVVGAKLNTVYSRLRLARARFTAAVARRHRQQQRELDHGSR